ncbi:testis expressed protein 56 [Ochotona princeps]|uniref:testis expressed protein 56 n=1 Tax=Ochotona princeps TaxID=9978 RepID=UPI0027150F33|nr:testis expressed protein 56 [Ochotona princeps]
METASNNPTGVKFPPLTMAQLKNYAHPDILARTFENLSNLHRLLPSHLTETLCCYKSEEDKQKGEDPEFSGLEKVLARYQLPEEVHLSPKPSKMPSWKRKSINSVSEGWKKCHLWKKNTEEPPMSTIVVRWLKKNMQPTEDLKSVISKLSVFGPIQSVTPCGRQSATVVYEDMISACRAVSAFQSQVPGTMFQCSWKQRFLSKNNAYSRNAEKTQPKKSFNNQETEERNKKRQV